MQTRWYLVQISFTGLPFLSRVSTLTRDIDIAILSVRLSVRDTLVLYEKGLTYRHSFFFEWMNDVFINVW